jgi:hypothetical protein
MKNCLNCGEEVGNDVRHCPTCGRTFAHVEPLRTQASDSNKPAAFERPDGSIPKTLGIAFMILAVVLAIWAGSMDVTTYSYLASGATIDADKLATKTMLTLSGEGFFALGLILWLAGYIVYAISFLPGRTDA